MVKQWCGETLGDLEPVHHLFMVMSEITLATYAELAPKSSQERIRLRVLQNAEENKLVLDFYIPSTAHKSHIHCYFILGRNNKSPKHK